MTETKSKSKIGNVVKAMIGLAMVAILLYRSNLGELEHLWYRMQPRFLWFVFGFVGVEIYIGTLKLQMILKKAGYAVPIWTLIKISFISLFVGQFVPTQLGVDGIRVFYLSRHLGHTVDSISSVALDRFINLIIITMMAAVSYFLGDFHTSNPELLYIILPMLVGTLLLLLLFLTRNHRMFVWMTKHIKGSVKIVRFFDDLNVSLNKYGRDVSFILTLFLLSLLFQSARFTTSFFLARTMDIQVNYTYFYIWVPVVTILAMLPFSFAGLGITQFSTVYILERVGVTTEVALGYAFLHYIFQIFMSLPGSLFFYLEGMHTLTDLFKRKKKSL